MLRRTLCEGVVVGFHVRFRGILLFHQNLGRTGPGNLDWFRNTLIGSCGHRHDGANDLSVLRKPQLFSALRLTTACWKASCVLVRSCCCESIDSSMSLTACCVWVIRVSVESTCDETVSIARGDVEKGDQRRSIPELAAVIVSGCPRTKFRILAGDSRDPMGGIERSEGPHESAAAIGCNHRHEVHVVAKKL